MSQNWSLRDPGISIGCGTKSLLTNKLRILAPPPANSFEYSLCPKHCANPMAGVIAGSCGLGGVLAGHRLDAHFMFLTAAVGSRVLFYSETAGTSLSETLGFH